MQEINFRRQRFGSPERFINRLKYKNYTFSVRLGSECTEIVFGDTLFTFTSSNNFPREKLFLFLHVKRDVKKWLSGKTSIEMPIQYDVTKYNPDYRYDRSIGIDLNHAYWRIAFLKGIISEKTYNHGLVEDNKETKGNIKALRLATLSILGRAKVFDNYVDGIKTDSDVVQKEDLLQKAVFKYIRLVCYDMMAACARKLGKDFDCWKTDCIYFHDTEENRKKVIDYFDKKMMPYKILDYFGDENE